jgi:hypothetical protein
MIVGAFERRQMMMDITVITHRDHPSAAECVELNVIRGFVDVK